MRLILACLVGAAFFAKPAHAQSPGTMCSLAQSGPVDCIRPEHFVFDLCQQIENTSRNNGINPAFFARLLWQESRFDPNALSHAGAQGIAQFMPGTAKLRGLPDSYNPAQAVERSANYLGELQRTYGNEGLAAVAYNGGEGRANGFTKAGKGLARETENYVPIITGVSAERWRDDPPKNHDFRLDGDTPFLESCINLAKDRRLTKLAPPPPRFKPWGVQVGFGRSIADAKANMARLTTRCSAIVQSEKMDFLSIKSRIRGRPNYIMARIGRNTQNGADTLCRAIRATGCICRVYQNKDQ
ncbi:MAG: lytic transglycosylase domain-containing protein [Lentilitoribacter sp.]